MGKKRNRKKLTSKGIHSSVNRALVVATRQDRNVFDALFMKRVAWEKGQNPWITMENPSKNETNKPFIRVRSDALWGNPKDNTFPNIFKKDKSDVVDGLH